MCPLWHLALLREHEHGSVRVRVMRVCAACACVCVCVCDGGGGGGVDALAMGCCVPANNATRMFSDAVHWLCDLGPGS